MDVNVNENVNVSVNENVDATAAELYAEHAPEQLDFAGEHGPAAEQLCAQLIALGDEPGAAANETGGIADRLCELRAHCESALKSVFAACVVELAHKPHVYAALLRAVAARDPEFAQSVLCDVAGSVAEDLVLMVADRDDRTPDGGARLLAPARVRSALRFFCCCERLRVVTSASAYAYLGSFAALLQAASAIPLNSELKTLRSSAWLDFVAHAITSAIVYLRAHDLKPEQITIDTDINVDLYNKILASLCAYNDMRAQESRFDALAALRSVDPVRWPGYQSDNLTHRIAQVLATRGTVYPLNTIIEPNSEEQFQSLIVPDPPAILHSLPGPGASVLAAAALSIPGYLAPEQFALRLVNRCRVPGVIYFEDKFTNPANNAEVEENTSVPPEASLERFMATDFQIDLLILMQFNLNEHARSLLNVKDSFSQGIFASEPDQNADQQEPVEPKYTYELLLMETVIAQMFRVPGLKVPPVYYTNVIMNLCRMAQTTVPRAFARVLRHVFDMLESFDMECFMRLVNVFPHHLSNFMFKWNWKRFLDSKCAPESDSTEHLSSPSELSRFNLEKQMSCEFIVSVFERMLRLAVKHRVENGVPDHLRYFFESICPRQPSVPDFVTHIVNKEFQNNSGALLLNTENMNASVNDAVEKISELVKPKVPDDTEVLNIVAQLAESTGCSHRLLRFTVMTAIIKYSLNSLTHCMSTIENRKLLLGKLTLLHDDAEQAKQDFVSCVILYFRNNRQWALLVLGLLLKNRVLKPIDIINWIRSASTPVDEVSLVRGQLVFMHDLVDLCAGMLSQRVQYLTVLVAENPETEIYASNLAKSKTEQVEFTCQLVTMLIQFAHETCNSETTSVHSSFELNLACAVLRTHLHEFSTEFRKNLAALVMQSSNAMIFENDNLRVAFVNAVNCLSNLILNFDTDLF